MPRRDQVIAVLRAHEGELRARGVQGLVLFGSLGRGKERAGSDVDLFFDHPPGLGFEVIAIQERCARSSPRSTSPPARACIRSCTSGFGPRPCGCSDGAE
jgi:hypothetical protein